MQALHCIFGVGSLVAPLVSEPFLLKKADQEEERTTREPPEWTSQSVAYSASVMLGGSNASLESSTLYAGEVGESQVMYAYLISGVLMLLSCCAMTWTYLMGDKSLILRKKPKLKTQQGSPDEKEAIAKHHIVNIAFLVLLAIFFATYVTMDVVYGTFLMTFAVKQLGWSKTNGAAVTSAFMGVFTVGRGLGIVLVNFIRPSILLTADLILCVIFSVILTGFVNMHVSVLWICSVGLGLGMATVYATGFTWTETYTGVSGKVSALILAASAVGEMSGPAMSGPLMEKVGYMSYVYLTLSLSLLCLVTMIALHFMGFKMRKLTEEESASDIVAEVDAEEHCLTPLRQTSQQEVQT